MPYLIRCRISMVSNQVHSVRWSTQPRGGDRRRRRGLTSTEWLCPSKATTGQTLVYNNNNNNNNNNNSSSELIHFPGAVICALNNQFIQFTSSHIITSIFIYLFISSNTVSRVKNFAASGLYISLIHSILMALALFFLGVSPTDLPRWSLRLDRRLLRCLPVFSW